MKESGVSTTFKIIVFTIVGLLLGAAIGFGLSYYLGISAITPAEGKKEYTIGMIADLTGEGADYGIEVRDAGFLTIDEINSFLKEVNVPVSFKLEIEDSKTTVEGAVAAAQSLGGKGIKIIVGHLWSGQANGIKSYIDSHKIFTVSVSSTSPLLSIPNDYLFRMQAPDSIQGRVIAHLIWRSGYNKVAAIYRNDPYGSGVFKYFEEEFKKLGGTIKSLAYTPDLPDYSSEVLQLSGMVKELGEDKTAVLIIAFNYEAIKMFDKARVDPSLSNVQWFSSESLKGPGLLPPAGPTEIADFLVKVKLTGAYPASLTENELMKKFTQKFKERYGREPKAYGAYTYDALWLVAISILSTGSADADVLTKFFVNLASKYTGATGLTTLDLNGDRALQDYQIWQVEKMNGYYDFQVIGGWSGATNELMISS
ncbi:MAG: ABC transporter substrate-binding protein [Nitrososphaerota archaeon]